MKNEQRRGQGPSLGKHSCFRENTGKVSKGGRAGTVSREKTVGVGSLRKERMSMEPSVLRLG